MKYAQRTQVSVKDSIREVQDLIEKYGGGDFAYGKQGNHYAITFDFQERRIRFVLTIPNVEDFRTTEAGRKRDDERRTLRKNKRSSSVGASCFLDSKLNLKQSWVGML